MIRPMNTSQPPIYRQAIRAEGIPVYSLSSLFSRAEGSPVSRLSTLVSTLSPESRLSFPEPKALLSLASRLLPLVSCLSITGLSS
jgi:hypothetical protein